VSIDNLPVNIEVFLGVQIRPEVLNFAIAMEKKLRMNDYKGGWQNEDIISLEARIGDEFNELKEAKTTGDKKLIQDECCDIANFCMMIFDLEEKNNI